MEETVIVSEADVSRAAQHSSQPWIPRDTSGRETPWLDDRGRLWATHDLTIHLPSLPEPTAPKTLEHP